MAKKLINTGDTRTNYELFKDGVWTLKGKFTKWNDSEVEEIKFELTNHRKSYVIQDINYCKSNNRLEIHVFKGNNNSSDTFTAGKSNLKGMTLDSKEEREMDFIDYYKDDRPSVQHCFEPNTGVGTQPETKKGNILQGNP